MLLEAYHTGPVTEAEQDSVVLATTSLPASAHQVLCLPFVRRKL